MSVDLKI